MKYGIIFGGNSSNSKMIFTLQKRTVRIIFVVKSRNSCRNLFMRWEILPLPCEYIFTLMNFVVNNQEHFQTNSGMYSVSTRNRDHLHRPCVNPCSFQKTACYFVIKIFNSLPSNLRSLMNKKAQFKVALKRYLNTHCFYSVEEFLTFKNDTISAKFFFPFCFDLVWYMYTLCQTFLCIFKVFWKSIFLWFCHFVSVLFLFCCCCCCCICLYILYLYDLFHILLLLFQTYGSMERVCVCVCVREREREIKFWELQLLF
jgi:hypothetical protein